MALTELATAVAAKISLARQPSFDVPNTADLAQQSRTNWTVSKKTTANKTARVRADRRTQSSRHGAEEVSGGHDDDMSVGGQDLLLESVLGGTFRAGPSLNASFDVEDNVLTRATGNFIADKLVPGMIVKIVGVGRAYIADVSAKTLSLVFLDPAKSIPDGLAQTLTVSVEGKVLRDSAEKNYLTAQVEYVEGYTVIQESLLAGSAAINVPTEGNLTVSTQLMGKSQIRLPQGQAPYPTSTAPMGSSEVISSPSCLLLRNGDYFADLVQATININSNVSAAKRAGSKTARGLIQGSLDISANATFYLTDLELVESYDKEDEFDLVIFMPEPGDIETVDFQCIIMPRVKLDGFETNLTGFEAITGQSNISVLGSDLYDGTIWVQSTAPLV